jgi:hypothetical protein
MDTKTLLWIISALLAVIIFFVQDVWRDVKAMKTDIEDRTLILDCKRTHEDVDKYLHHHAKSGTSGEEVLK